MKDFMLVPFFAMLLDSFVLMAQNFSQIPSRRPTSLQTQEIQQHNMQYRSSARKQDCCFQVHKVMNAGLKVIAS